MEPSRNKQVLTSVIVLVVIAAIVVGVMALAPKQEGTAVSSESPNAVATTATSSTTSTNASSAYKDGTYTATGSYDSPSGTEEITVTVTLKNNVVTATSAQNQANSRDSQEYQSMFISGYKSLVIGKKVDTISLSRVSGSSLTPMGFNNALTQIKSQAKS